MRVEALPEGLQREGPGHPHHPPLLLHPWHQEDHLGRDLKKDGRKVCTGPKHHCETKRIKELL